MISYRTGNLLDAPGIPVIPVNCVGVMGAGLAKQAADKWPWIVAPYKDMCHGRYRYQKCFEPGDVAIESDGNDTICLFATKQHWRSASDLDWIERGLKRLVAHSFPSSIFNVPKLGCGLGGLDWADVKPLMVKYLTNAPGAFNIYE